MRTDTNRQWTTYRILDQTIDNPDLADPLNLGEDGTGKGFILWGDTLLANIEWDEVNNRLLTTGATIRMGTADKLEFRDATTYIYAAGAGGLTIYGGTEIIATTPVLVTTGTLRVAGQAMGSGLTLVTGTLEVAAGGLTVSGGATITGTIAGLGGLTIAGAATIGESVWITGRVDAAAFWIGGSFFADATSVDLGDDVQLRFGVGTGGDAVIEWDTAETIDTLKIGVDTGTRCLVITEKGNISTDLSLPQMSNPCLVMTTAGSSSTDYHYRRSYLSGEALMIIDKFSTTVGMWLLQSTQDTNDSHFIQRRVWDGDATGLSYYNWYLDTRPILWDSVADDAGIFLGKKDVPSWNPGTFPSGTGSRIFGIANNDGTHFIYLYVDTSGDLHVIDEAGNDAKIVTSAGTITPA